MSKSIEQIKISLKRCNQAYLMYQTDQKYYQAKRIYKANLKLYKLLEDYLNTNPKNIEETINFLFHLEDWFEQFAEQETALKDDLYLNSKFVFVRLDKSPEYPKDFLKHI